MKLRLLTIFTFLAAFCQAATYTTTATPGTWDLGAEPGTTPLASDDIVINHDWSGYDWAASSARANYAGSLTINSGGYIKLNNSATNWTGTIDVKAGGVLVVNGAYSFDGGTINVDGYFEVTSNNLAITNGALTITGTGEVSYGSTSGPGTIAGTITLPVELSKFKGTSTERGNLLEWQTLSEINNDYFEVQKSSNGIDFSVLDVVDGNGSSFEVNNYSFLDYSSTEIMFYRLKQVDFNGDFAYSHTIVIGDQKNELSLLQKSNSHDFSIVNLPDGQIDVQVFTLGGKLLNHSNFYSEKGGISNFTISNNGFFFVTIKSNNGIVSNKVIVK